MDAATFLVTDLITGNVLDEVEISSFNWNELLNRSSAGAATARIDHPKTTRTNFNSWSNGLWCVIDGDIYFGGAMGAIAPRSGTRVLNVPVNGFLEYYKSRFIRSKAGMAYTSAVSDPSSIYWSGVDVYRVIEDILNHANSFTRGDVGLDVTYSALSGLLYTGGYYSYEFKPVATAIEQLCDYSTGAWFDYQYYWNGNNPGVRLLLRPRVSVVQDTRLEFRGGQNTPYNVVSVDTDAPPIPYNGVAGVGAGEGQNMLTAYAADLNTGAPLYEEMVSYKDVSVQATLSAHVAGRLARTKNKRSNLKVSIDWNKSPRPNECRVGDTFRADIVDGSWIDYRSIYYLYEKQMTFTESGDLDFKMSLEDAIV